MSLSEALLDLLRAHGSEANRCVSDLEACMEARTDTLPMFLDCIEWFDIDLPCPLRQMLDEYVSDGEYWAEECAEFLAERSTERPLVKELAEA